MPFFHSIFCLTWLNNHLKNYQFISSLIQNLVFLKWIYLELFFFFFYSKIKENLENPIHLLVVQNFKFDQKYFSIRRKHIMSNSSPYIFSNKINIQIWRERERERERENYYCYPLYLFFYFRCYENIK